MTESRQLVFVFLRGGADGLALVLVPRGAVGALGGEHSGP